MMRTMHAQRDSADVVVLRLQALAPLGVEAVQLLRRMEVSRPHRPGSDLVDERDPALRPCFIASGWAARVRWLSDGRRQIISFVTPGDAVALSERPDPITQCATVALTDVRTFDAREVAAAMRSGAKVWADLKEAVNVAASLDACTVMNQVVRLGRHTAFERMCHLLLELHDRMARIGLAANGRFPLPLTQEVLADATGLSTVHVNRILQQLRRQKLIDLRSGYVALLDLEALAGIADFRSIKADPWRSTHDAPPPRPTYESPLS
jgi:CRP-like cAMP-binding protein